MSPMFQPDVTPITTPSTAQQERSISHKRALSSNLSPYQGSTSLVDELRNSRASPQQQQRSPISSRPRIASILSNSSSSSSSLNFASGGGITNNSARDRSSSSAIVDSDLPNNSDLSHFLQQRPNDRRLSNEELIDVMEKEQDAIVLRLMREISSLKEENKLLRQQVVDNSKSNARFNSNYITDDSYSRYNKRALISKSPRSSSTTTNKLESIDKAPRFLDIPGSK